jgi:hypothetical protein
MSNKFCCSFQDRHGSVATEVVTPSPSDPKKTFFRQSTPSESYSSSPHLQEYQKTIQPYPVGTNEQHWSSEAHGPSHAADTTKVGAFDKPQVVGPNPGSMSRNVNSANACGSPLQPGKARVTNELERIAEHYGEK